MKHARDDFAVLLAFSILIVLFFQVVINAGMNLGIMPVTGIPFAVFERRRKLSCEHDDF